MTKAESDNYRAFLLRFWRDDAHSPWRATLENPHTSESLGFSSMATLFAFLQELTEQGVLAADPDQAAGAADL